MKGTRRILLWMTLATEPLVALYSLLPFILRKEFGSSLFQISLFIAIRPLVSLFSLYWSAYLREGRGRLVLNVLSATVLAYLPFAFFPSVDRLWFLLLASAMYQFFSKAALPAFVEILKRKLPRGLRERTFSLLFFLSLLESGLLGLCFGGVLDVQWIPWQYLFLIAALLGLSGALVFAFLRVPHAEPAEEPPPRSLLHPWRECIALLRARPDFAHFQAIFMVGGASIMLILPALASYYADTLQLSYVNLTTARFVFMALGVGLSSLFWTRGLERMPLLRLTWWVLLGFCLFPLVALLAQVDIGFLYLAFFLFGVAQAGSHLIWNLSGTFFAGEGDSAPYTRVTIWMHALRGALFPVLGGVLCDSLGAVPLLIMGAALCSVGAYWLARRTPSAVSA